MNPVRILRQLTFVTVLLSAFPDKIGAAKAKEHVKFSDDWGQKYPQCNPGVNINLSPVNINTQKAQRTNTRTLLTYSYDPIKNYTLHSGYYDKVHNVAMSALTITVDDLIFFECTYINGLGYENFQIFDKAVFFFSKSPLGKGRSFHQMNGKTYPMEIMFYFTNKQLQHTNLTQDPSNVVDNTQVYVLVEFQKEDNQVWFPVIEAARRIKKMKPKKAEIDTLKKKLENATNELKNLTDQKAKMIKTNSSVLKSISRDLGSSQENLEADFRRKTESEKEFYHLKKIADDSQVYSQYYDLENVVSALRDTLDEKKAEAANLTKQPFVAATAQILAFEKNKVKEEITKIIDEIDLTEGIMQRILLGISPSEKVMQTLACDVEILKMKIKENEDRITSYQANSSLKATELDLRNVTLFRKTLQDMIRLEKDIKKTNQTINQTKKAIKDMEQNHHWSARMTTFQVSWLFPATGGYYAYNSSIPLPPCQKIRYTVVLNNTIKISKKQYNVLASIPAYDGYEHLDQMAAPLRDLGGRTVWVNKKFIQFQRDDGLHIKSIVRAQMKRDKKKNQTDKDEEGSAVQQGFNLCLLLGLIALQILF